MAVSSYGAGTQTSGQCVLALDLTTVIEGRDI
jgi:hypoxanthine-guanine phosphoribosyltransferase